ncbi:MAG TPA: hypothetical protein EYG52_16070 [Pseudomonadales bacterium]|jgi:DMSO/TMAO reductase YedYZ heme-binding membrane subunit|nr:hypothetical protein [Gammaproteobacteria bacterium]HIL85016.1 hypothetical protein [Pseudomonadales bacterium]
MNLDLILKSKAVNGWGLFGLIAGPMCLVIIAESIAADLSTGAGVSQMIGFSVRIAVPFIYLVVAASSVHILFPSLFSRWWLRNRPYIGFCFAVAMAWQATFIFIMSNVYRDYYYQDVYLLRDEIEGSVGYIFLVAMVVTSFRQVRAHMNQVQWKLVHTFGIYVLWAYPFSVYWWTLNYYENPTLLDYVYYWAGFLAVALRIAAWWKVRSQFRDGPATHASFKFLGIVLIVSGLVASTNGLLWQNALTEFLTTPTWSAELVLWLPFWPFEPFFPLFFIALGTMALTFRKRDADSQPQVAAS